MKAAPLAFLLAVTAAVLGIHYGLQSPSAAPPAARVVQTTPVPQRHAKKHPVRRYAIVQRGDSFSSLAVRAHTTVAALERLNPGVSTTALRVGQRIRVH